MSAGFLNPSERILGAYLGLKKRQGPLADLPPDALSEIDAFGSSECPCSIAFTYTQGQGFEAGQETRSVPVYNTSSSVSLVKPRRSAHCKISGDEVQIRTTQRRQCKLEDILSALHKLCTLVMDLSQTSVLSCTDAARLERNTSQYAISKTSQIAISKLGGDQRGYWAAAGKGRIIHVNWNLTPNEAEEFCGHWGPLTLDLVLTGHAPPTMAAYAGYLDEHPPVYWLHYLKDGKVTVIQSPKPIDDLDDKGRQLVAKMLNTLIRYPTHYPAPPTGNKITIGQFTFGQPPPEQLPFAKAPFSSLLRSMRR